MANITGRRTVNTIKLYEVDGDPSTGSGTVAPIGTMASVTTGGGVFVKTTSSDTGWTVVGPPVDRTQTLVYASSLAPDFNDGYALQSVSLTGDITFTSSNLGPGRAVSVRIVADGSTRTLAFPGTWSFLGSAAPASIDASKVGTLSAVSWGSSDGEVVAGYAVTP